MDIPFKNIYDRCEMLSDYEGATFGSFATVHITEQDYPLLDEHISEAYQTLSTSISNILTSCSISTSQIAFEISNVWNGLPLLLEEAISAYVLSQWLGSRLPERAPNYVGIYNNLVTSIMINARRNALPKRKKQ